MNPPFVKKFDFRGVYGQDITEKDAFYLGHAIQKVLPLAKVLVGWDTRVSSEKLALSFMQSFNNSGVTLSFLQKCPIDYVTTAANAFDFDYSVMFTGSHNPWTWTGLLMHTKGGASVQGALVGKIVEAYTDSLAKPYELPSFILTDFDDFQPTIEETYTNKLTELIPFDTIKPMRVLVDIGDGSGSKSLTLLSHLLPQVTFLRINDRELYDAHTPHTADPSIRENMQQLVDAVRDGSYDCGFAFDSDADRVLGVDEKGDYLNGSVLASAMVQTFVDRKRSLTNVGYAVECGPALYNAIVQANETHAISLTPVPVPVGRSILREMVRTGEVAIAVENVGHFYLEEFFNTDSGTFSLALLLYWMSVHGPLSQLTTQFPDGEREQFALPLDSSQQEHDRQLREGVKAVVQGEQKEIDVDGVRYEFFENGKMVTWCAMRPSGYEKAEKYYFGSLYPETFRQLKEVFHRQ